MKEELARVDKHNRVQRMDEMLEEMQEREEKLWFFDNEEQIDIELEKRQQMEKVETTKKITKREQKAIDDAYIPPEVERKRN